MHVLLLLLILAAPPTQKKAHPKWLGEKMPLSLSVRTPEDLTFKAAAEKQYLIFNLLTSGKRAWDKGDYATALQKWETLLRVPRLSDDLRAIVAPFAKAARKRAGSSTSIPAVVTPKLPHGSTAKATNQRIARATNMNVRGVISGGGRHGPGGAVVWLMRAQGRTPRPRSVRIKAVVQKNKRFKPHVLAVPLNATVEFRNDDEIFHNVFSLSKPNNFDLGLYKSGASKKQVFKTPGPVHLLCNIHSSMSGYIYVVPSPWFAQANFNGRFVIKNVPHGNYRVYVWHEYSSKKVSAKVHVKHGMKQLFLTVDGDRRPPVFVPDKAGKPRQPQLGY